MLSCADVWLPPVSYTHLLSPEEYSHLAAYPFCCEQFADYIENQELITAPAHLKSSIMERSRDLDVQIVAGSNHLSKRLQLFYFSLKVGAAVLCALTMLTILPGVSREISARQDAAARQSKFRSEQQWDYYCLLYTSLCYKSA